MICPKTKQVCKHNDYCIGTGTGGYAGDDCYLVNERLEKDHKNRVDCYGIYMDIRNINSNYNYYNTGYTMIPCLMIMWNRLEYTKQALQSLIESDVDEIFIWDNNSDDGTQEYLNSIESPKIHSMHFNYKNDGIAEPMNWFMRITKYYEYVCKIDNDTLIPKDFCKRMLPHMEKADIVQAKHKLIKATCPGGWDEFIKPMRKEGNLYFNSFVGGSGVLMRRSVLSELPHTDWLLYSWRTWQRNNPNVIKAFANDCEIKLLDEEGYQDYPEYYRTTKRLV